MTFQEQCMKLVFPKLIEGTNAANRKAEHAEAKADALASEVAQLQAKVQELEQANAELQEYGRDLVNDLLDRVNALEAKAAEKKTRKPRAKKQDPVQSVEEAAKRAAVDKAMDAVLEDAARRESMPEPGTYQTAGTTGRAGVYGTAGETKTAGVSGTADLPPDMQGLF